jgi:hypothetical protein
MKQVRINAGSTVFLFLLSAKDPKLCWIGKREEKKDLDIVFKIYLSLSKGSGKVPIGEYLELFAQLCLVSERTSPTMLCKLIFSAIVGFIIQEKIVK